MVVVCPWMRRVWIGVQGTSRWRCTRYVALHPNRRGVMPTVRVHCPSEQVKVWSACAEVTVSHRVEDCLVTVACGLVDMIDLAKAGVRLVLLTLR